MQTSVRMTNELKGSKQYTSKSWQLMTGLVAATSEARKTEEKQRTVADTLERVRRRTASGVRDKHGSQSGVFLG